jgi:hypothetical protein
MALLFISRLIAPFFMQPVNQASFGLLLAWRLAEATPFFA